MTDKTQEIFLVDYNPKRQFKEPDNLSNHSEEQKEQKKNKKANDSQSDEGGSLVDQFDQTPIHKYGSRPVCIQTPQGSQREDEQKGDLQRNKLILEFKVSELQKICNTLTSANSKLLDKIQQLQQENDRQKSRIVSLQKDIQQQQPQMEHNYYGRERESEQNSVQMNGMSQSRQQNQQSVIINGTNNSLQQQQQFQQEQQLQQEVSDIQKMIKQYREQLKKSQQVNKSNKLIYQNRVEQLQQTIQQLTVEMEGVNQLNLELQERLHQLDERNCALQQELIDKQEEIKIIMSTNNVNNKQLNYNMYNGKNPYPYNNQYNKQDTDRTQSQTSHYYTPSHNIKSSSIYHNQYDDDYINNQTFSSTVQIQLQKLIDKLVKQLQTQRSTKAKVNLQLKRVQSQLLSSQKLIIHKNQQIHQLQMQILQYEKNTLLMKNSNKSNMVINTNNSMVFSPSKNSKQIINKSDYFVNKQQQQSQRNPVTTSSNKGPIVTNSLNKNIGTPQYRQKSKIQQQQPQVDNKSQRQQVLNKNINIISNNKSTTNTLSNRQSPTTQQQQSIYKTNPTALPYSKYKNRNNTNNRQRRILQTLSFRQLLSKQQIKLTTIQRLYIGLKLIQFYQHKIYTQKNYKLLSLDDVILTNYNTINLRLIKIKTKNMSRQYQQNSDNESLQRVIENMCQLMNSLLTGLDVDDYQGNSSSQQSKKRLLKQKLTSVVQNNQTINQSTFLQLKTLTQSAINQTIQNTSPISR